MPNITYRTRSTESKKPSTRSSTNRFRDKPMRHAESSAGPARRDDDTRSARPPSRFSENRSGDDRRPRTGGFGGRPKPRSDWSERPPRRDGETRTARPPSRFSENRSSDDRRPRTGGFGERPKPRSDWSERPPRRDGETRTARPPSRFSENRSSDDRRPRTGGFGGRPKPRSDWSERPPRRDSASRSARPARSSQGDFAGRQAERKSSKGPAKDSPDPATEKLQKVLARAGQGARREVEDWIREGRITVDGKPATIGERVSPDAVIHVDGHPVSAMHQMPTRRRVLLYHKPEGEICTQSDPEGRPTVFENLPILRGSRWVMVGRLDINSSGLLVFSNDGEWANQMMHPSSEIEREYAVRVFGEVFPEMLKQLKIGVEIDGHLMKFESIQESDGEGMNRWYHVILKEGRNREVRKLWESQGLQVSRLMRVRYGSIVLPRTLHRGQWQELSREEVDALSFS